MLTARDRQHAEGPVAVSARDDRLHARHVQCLGNIDADDLAVRIWTAIDTAGELSRLQDVGGVFGAAGDLLRAVDHGDVVADIVNGDGLVHGATPCALSAAAYFTASMI